MCPSVFDSELISIDSVKLSEPQPNTEAVELINQPINSAANFINRCAAQLIIHTIITQRHGKKKPVT